ncbi:MAG: GH3 auxin-responsive promoter family protein [Saprospiraceae bacterium]|nr:GH3 auxin-responsive promoter family protein [Saprospiraceae bacterium]
MAFSHVIRRAVNQSFKWYFDHNYQRIVHYMNYPFKVQESILHNLIDTSIHTEFGVRNNFSTNKKIDNFYENVPISDYESLKGDIHRMMMGEKDILCSGQVKWYAKSSGTTNDKSKFLPLPPKNLKRNHIQGTWDTMTLYYHQNPDAKIFHGKGLVMGGSLTTFKENPSSLIGDVSGHLLTHFPKVGKPFYVPDFQTALLPNWDEKIEKMANILINSDLRMMGGVPTWTLVLLKRVLELSQKQNLSELWPDLEVYVHGGVSFVPYLDQFKELIPSKSMQYMEIYNASEGFFGIQNDFNTNDMLLLLDNGIFYEFLPSSEWNKEHPKAIQLSEVQCGVNYAIVITTNAGLWRYVPGDTVVFTSTHPFKIRISGRTKQYVNAFGEEVMVDNTDNAIAATCKAMNANVLEYTVAPVYFNETNKASHEWLVEFEKEPTDIEQFNNLLDENLQKINSDYEAKRFKGMALERLRLKILPKGTFYKWLKNKGKFGAQFKVPRLANHREYVNEILSMVELDKIN